MSLPKNRKKGKSRLDNWVRTGGSQGDPSMQEGAEFDKGDYFNREGVKFKVEKAKADPNEGASLGHQKGVVK